MSFASFQEICAPSVVSHCAEVELNGAKHLCTVAGNRLTLYALRNSMFMHVWSTHLHGKIEALCIFQGKQTPRDDQICVLFKPAYVAFFSFLASDNALKCVASYALNQSALEEAYVARGPPLHRIAIDPSMRCLGVQVEITSLFIFPCLDTSDHLQQQQRTATHSPFCVPSTADGTHSVIVPDPGVLCMKRDLKLHSLDDWAFLHGYENTFPTILCSGKLEPVWAGKIRLKELVGQLLVVALDLKGNFVTPHIIWTSKSFYDVYQLVPLPAPIHGIVCVSTNALFYIKEHGSSLCQVVNGNAEETGELDQIRDMNTVPIVDASDLQLSLNQCSFLPITSEVLFCQLGPGHREGEVFLINIMTSSGAGSGQVKDFVWKSLGMAPVASTLCKWEETFIFLASANAGPCLLRLEEHKYRLEDGQAQPKLARRELMSTEGGRSLVMLHSKLRLQSKFQPTYSVNLVDELPSLGPFAQMSRFFPTRIDEEDHDNWDGQKLITSSGFGSKSATYVSSLKVPFDTILDFEVEEKNMVLTKIWTCGFPIKGTDAEYDEGAVVHEYAILSGKGKTMVLKAEEGIEEVDTNLRTDTQTLACGVVDGKIMQVTIDEVHTLGEPEVIKLENRSVPSQPTPIKLQKAAICGPFVAGIDFYGNAHVFEIQFDQAEDVTNRLLNLPHGGFTHVSFYNELIVYATNGDILVYDPTTDGEAVFETKRIDCAPCLLKHKEHIFRSLTDVTVQSASKDNLLTEAGCEILDVRLMDLDPQDLGPTLIVLLNGRPMLMYRSFLDPERSDEVFPFSFQLTEHRFVESISEGTITPFYIRNSSGCYITRGGSFPGLWIFARRNLPRVHACSLETGGMHGCTIAMSPFVATCVTKVLKENTLEAKDRSVPTFFTLRRKKRATEAVIVSFAANAGGAHMDMRSYPFPVAKFEHSRTPVMTAMHATEPLLAVAFVTCLPEPLPQALAKGEDGEEEENRVEKPPVDEAPPRLPRAQKCFELEIYRVSPSSHEVIASYSFESEEHVLSMQWVHGVKDLESGALMVGTANCGGEDLPCKGSFLVFKIDQDRTPTDALVPLGRTRCDKQMGMRGPVTCVDVFEQMLVYACGHRIALNKWDESMPHEEKRVVLVAFYDAKFCITSINRVKNYFLVGDIRKGLELIRWIDDSNSTTGAAGSRKFDLLSRSQSTYPLSVLATGVMVDKRVLGLVAMDHLGNSHLFQYQPNSDGREGDTVLWNCASFHMGGVSKSVQTIGQEGQRSLLVGTHNGGLFSLSPTDDQTYRTVTTLCGIMSQQLPFYGGLNPRAYRQPQETVYATYGTTRKNIEDVSVVRTFCFAHASVQDQIADRMQMPLRKLLKVVEPCATALI